MTWTERLREERSSSQREPTAAWTEAASCGRERRTSWEQAIEEEEEGVEEEEGEEEERVAPRAAALSSSPGSTTFSSVSSAPSTFSPTPPPGNPAASAASATAASASRGQGRNQSMVHLEKIAGNCPTRAANFAPTGDKQSRTWSLSLTLEERKASKESGVSGWRWRGTEEELVEGAAAAEELELEADLAAESRCASRNCGLTSEASASSSSRENMPATPPVPRNWLMYSRKASSRTSPSLQRVRE